ncbi:hypothetical protein JCM24511_08821 [Saitozyma sp. JCM 24511]|nr:hypothetical protein JCM24511_08821 [Saitozyma sp. JCM 24511]
MPPIVISFHTSPPESHRTSSSKLLTPLAPPRLTTRLPSKSKSKSNSASASSKRGVPVHQFFTYSKPPSAASIPTNNHDTVTRPTADVIANGSSAGSLPSPPPSSGSSSSGNSAHMRRKPHPTALDPSQTSASLTPLLQPILLRCLAWHSNPQPTSPSKKVKPGTPSSSTDKPPFVHPYNPLTDQGNDRSTVPSPREILRAQRLEEEKVRAKKESAAAARAAIVAKRKRGVRTRGGSRLAETETQTRSVSPVKEDEPEDTDKDKVPPPAITTEPASSESTPAPPPAAVTSSGPARIGLKRTRSNGLLNISTANVASGGIGVSSPLRVAIGPDETEVEADDGSSGREAKRAKSGPDLGVLDVDPMARGGAGRRATTLSPQSSTEPLPDDASTPKTYPLAAGRLAPRSTARSTSVQAQGGRNESSPLGTPSMRRAVSSAGASVGSRSRLGSVGAEGMARERSRREVNLPRALRDYEMRAGATA